MASSGTAAHPRAPVSINLVLVATSLTDAGIGQHLSAPASPPHPPRGVADDYGVRCDLPRNDSTRTDERVVAESMATDDRSVCADGHAPSDGRPCELVLSLDVGAWREDVREHAARSEKDVVANGDP